MPLDAVRCRVCGEQVYANGSGILKHTGRPTGSGQWETSRRGRGQVQDIPICPGSTPGARP